jgi:hypothetical protein
VVVSRRRTEHNPKKRETGGKGESAEKMSLTQQLSQQFSEQIENR